MQIDQLPTPPQTGQDEEEFVQNADNLFAALPTFVNDVNGVVDVLDSNLPAINNINSNMATLSNLSNNIENINYFVTNYNSFQNTYQDYLAIHNDFKNLYNQTKDDIQYATKIQELKQIAVEIDWTLVQIKLEFLEEKLWQLQ
jgi:uncharacterized membrane protein YgaE (UPF0421/DUF939 family)